ncbi:hypothetical protein GOP47_0030069 [Adiantum capillus-veneris]|nr:hypothetical protein GOP47_0030069 [Adiantum capillus-veneris]
MADMEPASYDNELVSQVNNIDCQELHSCISTPSIRTHDTKHTVQMEDISLEICTLILCTRARETGELFYTQPFDFEPPACSVMYLMTVSKWTPPASSSEDFSPYSGFVAGTAGFVGSGNSFREVEEDTCLKLVSFIQFRLRRGDLVLDKKPLAIDLDVYARDVIRVDGPITYRVFADIEGDVLHRLGYIGKGSESWRVYDLPRFVSLS